MPIFSPAELRKKVPLSAAGHGFLKRARQTARQILSGRDPRRVYVVGPCSIHERKTALDYALRLKQLAEEVLESCFVVMRAYCEKSRTSTGWKGLVYDPYLDGSDDVHTGLLWTRELYVRLAEMHVPVAAEFVDPLAAAYFEDLVTWGFIGARTAASQPHRQFVSSLEIPVGFKNPTDGHIDEAVHGVAASSVGHASLFIDEMATVCRLQSEGNPYAHLVLRGAHDFTNYDALSVAQALEKLGRAGLAQRVLIDCSHGNCQKQPLRQKAVYEAVIEQCEENAAIRGVMLESHLEEGYQVLGEDPSSLLYGVSITDPCIDWETTEQLLLYAHSSMRMRLTHN